MNVIELSKFKSFILDLQVSPFENSSDCSIVLTRDQLIIGFLAPTKELKWTTFKEIDMTNGTTAFAISPLSRTMLMPLLVRVAYADKGGIYILSFIEETLQNKQIVCKGDFEVTTICYNDDGTKLAFSGFDNHCHVLLYQDDALSDPDSIVSDAVGEGSYHHCVVNLTSPGACVRWHPTRNNYLVVLEINGNIRFLVSSANDDEKEYFICEYVINIGLKVPKPLSDMDFILGVDKTSFDFIVSCSSGLFLFALDKPLATLEQLQVGSGSCGNLKVKLSESWGCGSLLATLDGNHHISVTDLQATRVIHCPVAGFVALSWHKVRPVLLATSINSLVAMEFHDLI